MTKRYFVLPGKSVQGNDGSTLFTPGTIIRHEQICGKDGKIDAGLIRDGFVEELGDRPTEQQLGTMAAGKQLDQLGSRTAAPATKPVFEDQSVILDATEGELRAFAEEHLGQGRGEFQDDQIADVRQELLGLRESAVEDTRPSAGTEV